MVIEYTSKKNTLVYPYDMENGKYTLPCGILGYYTVITGLKKFEKMDYRRVRLLQFWIFSYQLYCRQW